MKDVLLFSAGMDSLIAYFYLNKPDMIYYRLGHRYEGKELRALTQIEDALKISIRRSTMFYLEKFEHADAHIPFRNRLLVQGAAMEFPDAEKIYLVAQKGEQSIPDRSPEFFNDMTNLISKEMERKVEVVNPFPHMTKTKMTEWYMQNVKDEKLLKMTVGCFASTDKHCGECGSCLRRSVALEANGIELDEMEKDIRKWEGIKEYITKMKAGKYDAERTEETLKVFKDWGYII